MAHIKIIIGSTRPNRFSVQVANFVHSISQEQTDHTFTLVDLKDQALPLLEEPMPPVAVQGGQYANEHVRKWASVIGEADGFIFVTPEYNHGVPGVLKNAIDSLSHEWQNKPVAFVSYGTDFGGTRAVEQLRASVATFNMFDLQHQFSIHNYWQYLNDAGSFQPTDKHKEDARTVVDKIGFWAEQFKAIRTTLANQ